MDGETELAERVKGLNRRDVLKAGAVTLAAMPADLRDPTAIPVSHAWLRQSVSGALGRPVDLLAGRVTGGSSAMNACVAMRGLPSDYDDWAAATGSERWRFENVLPVFRGLEADPIGEPAFHGRGGPVPILEYGLEAATPFQHAFFDAALDAGFPRSLDVNGVAPEGINLYKFNIAGGVRQSAALCYLTPEVRARGNLTIRGGALVDRVAIDGGRATGVVLADGERIEAGDVILSGGSYVSPAILMRSGAGPADDLATLNIPVLANLPVGRTLQDHPHLWMQFAADPARLGPTAPAPQSFLWTRSADAPEGVLDLHLTASHFFDPAASPTGAGFVIAVGLVKPDSIGRLTLRSRDPLDDPLIDPAFLAAPGDLSRMREGIAIAREFAGHPDLADMIEAEIMPGSAAADEASLDTAIRRNVGSYHYPVATVRMGSETDPAACADPEGRMFGIAGLRVIDASIMPTVPSVATNLSTMMLADALSGTIG